jgi:hypothetical protein
MNSKVLGLKTDSALLEALERVAQQEVSVADLREQRVSFVFGSMSVDSAVTRDQVKRAIERQDLSLKE